MKRREFLVGMGAVLGLGATEALAIDNEEEDLTTEEIMGIIGLLSDQSLQRDSFLLLAINYTRAQIGMDTMVIPDEGGGLQEVPMPGEGRMPSEDRDVWNRGGIT